MKSYFITELDVELCPGSDGIWTLLSPLVYWSDLLKKQIVVPHSFPAVSFYTDFASIPRWIPLASNVLLDTAHREGTLHDYLYRIDSEPVVSRSDADAVFREAALCRGKSWITAYTLWFGVRVGGWTAYHKHYVYDNLTDKEIKQHQQKR